jgi:hypothetical protein
MKNIIKVSTFVAIAALLSLKSAAQTISPIKDATGKYGFTIANVYFEVNPALGGRITSLKIDTTQILYLATLNQPNGSDNAGSTFWPSPQSVWNWPPPLALNYSAYKVLSSEGKLAIQSSIDATTKLYFGKIFTANTADTSITIQYIIKNTNTTAKTWAPWEITRVNNSGLSFFGIGSGSIYGNPSDDMSKRAKVINKVGWYVQDSTKTISGSKFFCDGAGWFAHKTNSGYLFIKKFADITKASAAPGEAEVECYTATGSYTELEDQGAYVSIAAGDSVIWQVKWFVRKLPANIKGYSGDKNLLNFVYKTMNPDTSFSIIKIAQDSPFEVFPNPVLDKLMITNQSGFIKNTVAEIYDLQGQLLLRENLANNQSNLDFTSFTSGAYLLQISGKDNQRLFTKMIVKK